MAALNPALQNRWRSSSTRWLLPFCLLFPFLIAPRPVDAQTAATDHATERKIKAAYLSKLGSYVEWPRQTFGEILRHNVFTYRTSSDAGYA